ncbi:hypothetical protein A3860_03870 [Niastella vici]|uniref:Transglutaminase-like domain-containing protein n=1 Tax=Niastella vici TaxID=1703345 RepID=A0A1V9FR84_9BACT|nr:hypothetical protein [Niastella vici]OQP60875.1 hypothetical protein A3860_03870 [Niastella vici]
MRRLFTILLILGCFAIRPLTVAANTIQFDFCGEPITFDFDQALIPKSPLLSNEASITAFYQSLNPTDYDPIIKALLAYKEKFKPDDWLYYQLIRKAVQQISPKGEDYHRYTMYKWYFLTRSGYDALLTTAGNYILFYIKCEENIYNIPTRVVKGSQYVCLNYHDYGNNIDFQKNVFTIVSLAVPDAQQSFTYKITHLPDFKTADYKVKDLVFNYNENEFHYKVKLNNQVQSLFINYPVVDYALYLNIPLSHETYYSLIPLLRKSVKGMSVKNGVDYLMRFTRYAFMFEPDTEVFGSEKRLSPEQTLLYDQSDCEDRVALFYCLVKEIYNLPMIVLTYPKHVTIAVQFNKPVGKPIVYNGNKYTICEPTPQKEDLMVGQLLPELKKAPYEVAYVYTPSKK